MFASCDNNSLSFSKSKTLPKTRNNSHLDNEGPRYMMNTNT